MYALACLPLACPRPLGCPALVPPVCAAVGRVRGVSLARLLARVTVRGWNKTPVVAGDDVRAGTCGEQRSWVECCFLTKVVLFFNIYAFMCAFVCMRVHSYAFHCFLHAFRRAAFYNLVAFEAFCNHFELLHSSDARRLHSDAFSYLLQFSTCYILMHFHASRRSASC